MVEFETKDGEGGWEGGRRKIAEGGGRRELALRKAKMFPCHCCYAITPAQ